MGRGGGGAAEPFGGVRGELKARGAEQFPELVNRSDAHQRRADVRVRHNPRKSHLGGGDAEVAGDG